MPPSTIWELEGLAYLDELAEEYKSQNGLAPFDLSHWDPSDHTVKNLLKHLRLPQNPLAIPYIYSYVEGKQQILQQLGYPSVEHNCVFVQAGTNAVLLAVWWLKTLNIKRIIVLCPAYFSVFYASEVMGLCYKRIYMRRDRSQWYIPQKEIMAVTRKAASHTAVWITNPVYCTGSYLSKPDIEFLNSLLDCGVAIVADECLSISGHELGRRLVCNDRFIGLYSPQKSVCVNAVKFAALVTDIKYQQFFDRWADVLVGGLSASNYSAILHFLTENYSYFLSEFLQYTNAVRKEVLEMLRIYSATIESDENSLGHYMMCYAPKVSGNKGNDKQFMGRLVSDTGAILIPGVRNYFDPNLGFSFRINLARKDPQFLSSLRRTINFLVKES